MNKHIFGEKTENGIFISKEAIGGQCFKCGTSWAKMHKSLHPIIKNKSISETIALVNKYRPCKFSDEEMDLKLILL